MFEGWDDNSKKGTCCVQWGTSVQKAIEGTLSCLSTIEAEALRLLKHVESKVKITLDSGNIS